MQRLLWSIRNEGALTFYTITDQDVDRIQELMEQYRDAPMDLADASLVVAAENLDLNTVFTLDRHFHAYLRGGSESFLVVP